MRTAHALAASQSTSIELRHIRMVLRAMKAFESDFEEDVINRGTGNDASPTHERPSKRQRVL